MTLSANIVITITCAFSAVMNKSLHSMVIKSYTCRCEPLFHSCYNSTIAKKTLPMQVHTHQSKEMEVRRYHTHCTVWILQDSPAKTSNVLHSL